VGIFHRDGAPAERALVEALTRYLSYRGPDAREVWAIGPVALGHASLRTTRESLNERQPASLDGRLWITADARLDCRAELEVKLEAAGRRCRRPSPDSELILQAYAAWGIECVRHLQGDFSFAIWDALKKTLFCARDHFGIKPFYYAASGDMFLFSNTLNCVRLHPDISEELNEAAIADFLLFGLNCDTATTSFRDVRRLPPAHLLVVSREGLQIERYWVAPTDGRIRYRRTDDYIEHFQVLLQAAVEDRLRADRVGILLSGGLDSAAVAASARELSTKPAGTADLRAYTVTYESLIPEQDGEHARGIAEFLHIPIRCLAVDGLRLFERWDDPELGWPEPVEDPLLAGLFDQFRMIAADCRVVLDGEGSDNLMHFEMWPYARDMSRNREWNRLFSEVPRYLRLRPFSWPGFRRRLKGVFGKDSRAPVVPPWIEPDFARRMNLEARWREWNELPTPAKHPILPKAHASLALPHWQHLFELQNAGVTHCPVEVRYPFLDLRIVNYLLALPPFPWFFEKTLLREAMIGRLPESVRVRPKTPLGGDPVQAQLQKQGSEWLNKVEWNAEMHHYINRSALGSLTGEPDSDQVDVNIRPHCLNFWLQSARRVRYNLRAEARNG
jgi:asparagine synthase (glutamine-hydrolysing)